MLRKAAYWIVGLIATTIGGYYILEIWQSAISSPSQKITVDFNAVQGCPLGRLSDIRDRQMGKDIPLTNGADSLTICDDQELEAVRSELPRALANRIPGCLVWHGRDTDGLVLVRKSDAVCARPNGKGFVCDGVNARHSLGNNAVGDSMQPVAPCSADLLRRFGFPP